MTWPPEDERALDAWLLDEMPLLRTEVRRLRRRIARAQEIEHQKITARLSPVLGSSSDVSDPTFQVIATWIDEIPEMQAELAVAEDKLQSYEDAKTVLPERQLRLVVLHYEHYKPPSETAIALSVSVDTYRDDKASALTKMLRSILGKNAASKRQSSG